MVDAKFPNVNGRLFLWRDSRGIVHASKEHHTRPFCGCALADLTYAGRMDIPTCLECVAVCG